MSAVPALHELGDEATLGSALAWAASQFSPLITDTPRLDAELLLAHCLGWGRDRLFAYPEYLLRDEQRRHFEALAGRHAQGEPIAYILGQQEFFGLDFFVDERVLIPRPETELLVEEAVAWLWTREPDCKRLLVADVGSGSGAIAVSLAVECPRLTLYATDTSAGALEVAAQNVKRHGVSERVRLLHGDLLAPLPEPVHLIAANLPYVSEAELAQLPPHIARFEPRLALDGGPDGLAVVERLLAQARAYLQPEGAILLEIGVAQGDLALARAQSFFPDAQVQVRQDHGARDRLLIIQI
ncbi:MAG: peptide chain release factor N(5)-glutamine methyltransferase [Anaerolineae bacterium]|nr:MAG: peptide chain release factor N(5)-glutamine methyltransferase [Anaerolineae bacterium]